MNLLAAASIIASTDNIETVFAIYSQSRSYKNGAIVRAQIEKHTQDLANLNGYKKEFHSFQELVEYHDDQTSPLREFPISGDILVIHQDYPLPYTLQEFLRLFRNARFLQKFVFLGQVEQGMFFIKYSITKGAELKNVRHSRRKGSVPRATTKDELKFRTHTTILESKAEIEEFALDKIPQSILAEIIQPAQPLKMWKVCFASESNFLLKVIDNFYQRGCLTYKNLDLSRPMTFDPQGWPTSIITDQEKEEIAQGIILDPTFIEKDDHVVTVKRQIFSYRAVVNQKYWDVYQITRADIKYETLFQMQDAIAYLDLPLELRWATYLLFISNFPSRKKIDHHELSNAITINGQTYRALQVGKVIYMASYEPLDDVEMERLAKYGQVAYLKEVSDQLIKPSESKEREFDKLHYYAVTK